MPRTPAIQAAEDALSLALLAMVVGTRPPVTPAMMLEHLHASYGLNEDVISVRRTQPDDFIVRFSRQADLDRVLSSPEPRGTPFTLRWRRWNRLISGSAGAFRFRVLVGMKGIPSHARSEEVAQVLLGSSGVKVEIANPDADSDPDDERNSSLLPGAPTPTLFPTRRFLPSRSRRRRTTADLHYSFDHGRSSIQRYLP